MFRLLESGLPKDKIFPADMECLEYFINSDDEIRNTDNPRAYFNYFLTKSDRCNNIQREAMDTAIRREVFSRLTDFGLNVVRLPLGAEETEKHVPIFMSKNISEKKRVIILFCEHSDDLGIFAYRIVGGKGGINKGSAVDLVKYIQSLPSNPENSDSPGIILANMGQLLWYRRGKRAVTWKTWNTLPQRNAVSGPLRIDPVENRIPGNTNPTEHLNYIFNNVVNELLNPTAVLDVIGVSDGANEVVQFLNIPNNWQTLGPRLNALALVAPYYLFSDLTNPDFRTWLRKRGRAYPFIGKPHYQALGGPNGGPECVGYGCNAYSLGNEHNREFLLPLNYKIVLDWLQEVINDSNYENKDLGFPVEMDDHAKDDIDQGQEDDGYVWSTASMAVSEGGEPTVSVIEVSPRDEEVKSETSKVNVVTTAIDGSSEAEVEVVDLTPGSPREELDNYDSLPEQTAAADITDNNVGKIALDNGQAECNGFDNEDDGYPDASDFDVHEVDTEPIKAWAWKVGPEAGEPDNEPNEAKAKYKLAKCGILEARARLDQAKEQYDISVAQIHKTEVERQIDRIKLVQLDAELGNALTQVRDFDRNIFEAELDVAIDIPYILVDNLDVAQISSWKGKILKFRERVSTFIDKTNSYLTQAKEYEQKIVELKDTFKTMKTHRDAYIQTLEMYTDVVESLMNEGETGGSETDHESFDRETDSAKAEIGVEANDSNAKFVNGKREQKFTARTTCSSVVTKNEIIYGEITADEAEIVANKREIEAIKERLAKETLEDNLTGQEAKIEVLKSFLGNFALKSYEGGADVERKQDINPTTVLPIADAIATGDKFESTPVEKEDVMNGNACAEK